MFSPKTKHQHFKWCLVGFEVAMNDKTLHIVCSLCFLLLLTMVTIVPNVVWLIPHYPHVWSLSCLHSPLWNSTWNQTCCTTLGGSLGQKHHVASEVGRCDVVNKNHPQINPNNDSGHIKHPICIISYHIIFPCVLQLLLVGYYIIKKKKTQPHALSLRFFCIDWSWLCDRPSLVAQLPHRARRGSPSLLPRAGAWRCYPSCNCAAAVAAPGPWLPRKPHWNPLFPRNKWAICKSSRRKSGCQIFVACAKGWVVPVQSIPKYLSTT